MYELTQRDLEYLRARRIHLTSPETLLSHLSFLPAYTAFSSVHLSYFLSLSLSLSFSVVNRFSKKPRGNEIEGIADLSGALGHALVAVIILFVPFYWLSFVFGTDVHLILSIPHCTYIYIHYKTHYLSRLSYHQNRQESH